METQAGQLPWNIGNTASLSGTLSTNYVDGVSIQFLSGQNNLTAINSGSYRPNPSKYVGGTVNGDGTASGGSFANTSTAPAAFGMAVHVDIGIAAEDSIYNVNFDVGSGTLLTGGVRTTQTP